MSTLDETYEPRPWRCAECNYILGVVMRDTNHVRRLWIFRHQRHDTNLPTTYTLQHPPRGLFLGHGVDSVSRPGGVECQACGALTDWSMSKEAKERLMEHFQVEENINA